MPESHASQLSRMASSGAIERVTQGVYRMAGAPPQNHEAIYATWLALGGATAPRTDAGVASIVAAGVTGAVLHDVGDFFLDGFDFIVPARKGTRLPGVRLRIRHLTRDEGHRNQRPTDADYRANHRRPDRTADRPVPGRRNRPRCGASRESWWHRTTS